MSYNIFDAGLYNKQINTVCNIINKYEADLVGMQEVDSLHYREGLEPQNHYVIGIFREKTKMNGYYAGAHYNNTFGLGMLSKEKAISHKKIKLPNNGSDDEERILEVAEFGNYVFFNTHFSWQSNSLWNRTQSASVINAEAKKYKNKHIFMTGDFNTTPETSPIQILLQDWEMLNNPNEYTFNTTYPNKTIDFVFAYKNKNANNIALNYYNIISREVIDERVGSDHFPVFVEVLFGNSPIFITYISSLYIHTPCD